MHEPTTQVNSIKSSVAGSADTFETEIEAIRKSISADDDHLKVARERTQAVRNAIASFPGVAGTYGSGSLFHETVNRPVNDGDCGAVLDRRTHVDLGPDSSANAGPYEIVKQCAAHVELKLDTETELEVSWVDTSKKRAIVVHFASSRADEPNPSVDLIIGLERSGKAGLWIPNLWSNDWDASDPQAHTALLTGPPADLRVHRARLIRLAKEIVKSNDPAVLISFNIEALALKLVMTVESLGEGLAQLFRGMSKEVASGLTADPAGVSPAIKLPDGISSDYSADRLLSYAGRLEEAQSHSSDIAHVRAALAEIFPNYYETTGSYASKGADSSSLSETAKALLSDNAGAPAVTSAFALPKPAKSTRAFGRAPR